MALEVTIPSIQPSQFWEAVSPSDTTVLTDVIGIIVGSVTGGTDLVMEDQNGNSVTFTVSAGQVLPVSPSKVMATGTTASAIVALK
jgi:hypothetical protein